MKIGLWEIPAVRNIEATKLARAAVRNKFAPTEQAESSKRVRVDEEMCTSETSRSQSTEVNDTKKAVEPRMNNPIAEKEASSEVTKGEGRARKAKTVGTGPVSLKLSHQAPHTNGSKGRHRAHGKTPPHDRLSTQAVLDYDMFVEYPQFRSPDKSVLWVGILSQVFANLFLHQCVEQADNWATGYVGFLLCVSSKEWRELSGLVGHSVVYFMFNLLLICLVKQ